MAGLERDGRVRRVEFDVWRIVRCSSAKTILISDVMPDAPSAWPRLGLTDPMYTPPVGPKTLATAVVSIGSPIGVASSVAFDVGGLADVGVGDTCDLVPAPRPSERLVCLGIGGRTGLVSSPSLLDAVPLIIARIGLRPSRRHPGA